MLRHITCNNSLHPRLCLNRHNTIMESPEARARAAELHKLALEAEKLKNPDTGEEPEEGENDGDIEAESEDESEGEGSNEDDDGEEER